MIELLEVGDRNISTASLRLSGMSKKFSKHADPLTANLEECETLPRLWLGYIQGVEVHQWG